MKPADPPVSLDEMMSRLDRAVAYSPADSTEILWIEARRSAVHHRHTGGAVGLRDRTLAVRVRQSGRTGLHRLGGADPAELENAVRDAMAQARLAPVSPAEPLAGAGERRAEPLAAEAYHDPRIADLDPDRVRHLLARLSPAPAPGQQDDAERLALAWLEGSVAIANSAGLRKAVRVTAASFSAVSGGGAGAGRVADAARHLDALSPAALLAEARERRASAAPGDATAGFLAAAPEGGEVTIVLAEQPTAALLDLLNRQALSAAALRDPTSCLHGRLGEALFAPCFHLRDDATDPRTLAFPFDLGGWPKRPVDMMTAGVFASSAVDPALGREIDRPPTPHTMAPDETIAANLLLLPGGAPGSDSTAGAPGIDNAGNSLAALLAAAGEGVWIGALHHLECFDPGRLRFRALARGVRRIAGGSLGAALPDLLWEASLPHVLAHAVAVGDRTRAIATGDLLFGATAAPPLALRGTVGDGTLAVQEERTGLGALAAAKSIVAERSQPERAVHRDARQATGLRRSTTTV